jgi:hypothetical protein
MGPRDPYLRQKYTREVKTARSVARDYFERFPKRSIRNFSGKLPAPQCDNYEFTMKRLRELKAP